MRNGNRNVLRKVTRFHLPDVGGAVATPDNEEVIERPPLDGRHREEMSRREHHTATFAQRQ